MMTDVIIGVVVAVIVGGALYYIYRTKKKGRKCIGCPDDCGGDCSKCGK